jgi:hypothetical protein
MININYKFYTCIYNNNNNDLVKKSNFRDLLLSEGFPIIH